MSSRLPFATHLRLAVRNLLRNRRRTAITLAAFVCGVGALTFIVALNDGWMADMKTNFVLTQMGHIQIHAEGFNDSRSIDQRLADPAPILAAVARQPEVAAVTARLSISALASVAGASSGVDLMGIDPENEPKVSRLREFVQPGGEWLKADDRRGLLLGAEVARQLDLAIGDKVVLMAQSPGGELVSELFRLRGILKSGAPEIDQGKALIGIDSARQWLEVEQAATEIVIRAQNHEAVLPLQTALLAELPDPNLEIMRWSQIDPMIEQWTATADASTFFILTIVIAVILIEVLNTMLMSMHERVREFGLMEAIGTGKRELFLMLLIETVLLVATGGLLGYLFGAAISLALAGPGIDISAFADAFAFFYMDPVCHPLLTLKSGVKIVGITLIAALIAGLYPAWKATRLNPVAAMREV